MNVNTYEGLFLLDSNRYARDPAIATQIAETIESAGGQVKVSRLWDERRLAYPINKMRKGTYWLVYFSIDTQKMTELNRAFQLNDNVVRMLFVKLHERLADAIVSHAGGEEAAKPETAKPETAKPEAAKDAAQSDTAASGEGAAAAVATADKAATE